jgi:hypothetical protein
MNRHGGRLGIAMNIAKVATVAKVIIPTHLHRFMHSLSIGDQVGWGERW